MAIHFLDSSAIVIGIAIAEGLNQLLKLLTNLDILW
jgi:hypothetical protein